MDKKWPWWVAALLFMVFLYLFTASPVSNAQHTLSLFSKFGFLSPKAVIVIDKIVRKMAHFVSFGFLAWLLMKAIQPNPRTYVLAWLLATLYGFSDEIHQIFVPGRTPLFSDVVIDSFGAALVLFLSYHTRQRSLLSKPKVIRYLNIK